MEKRRDSVSRPKAVASLQRRIRCTREHPEGRFELPSALQAQFVRATAAQFPTHPATDVDSLGMLAVEGFGDSRCLRKPGLLMPKSRNRIPTACHGTSGLKQEPCQAADSIGCTSSTPEISELLS